MKSIMQHNFAQIPSANIQRSVFDLSHGYKTTMDEGYLVPFYADEALPGDTFHASTTMFGRLASPLRYPILDNMFLETMYFAVPIRLIWENWERFCGAADPTATPQGGLDYMIPQMYPDPTYGFAIHSLGDYFGMPVGVKGATVPEDFSVSSLWHRAYNKIWNDWFRDENMQDPAWVYDPSYPDGPDNPVFYPLKKRGKRHDYFTSCLPWPQKGPGVEVPLGDSAPVFGTGESLGLWDGTYKFGLQEGIGTDSPEDIISGYNKTVGTVLTDQSFLSDSHLALGVVPAGPLTNQNTSGLYADLSRATSATINTLRQAYQIQRMFERDARGGTRYTEIVRSHFNVVSPDARLQRAEYLGGSSSRININPVMQSSTDSGTEYKGSLAANAVLNGHGGFSKSFTEHCVILGFVNVRCDLTYQQGLPRKFSRKTRWDFYWPSFAHLGEQPVYRKEIFACGVPGQDDYVFGYQERYAEMRHFPSQVTGNFRTYDKVEIVQQPTPDTPVPSPNSATLDSWHLSEDFAEPPLLNEDFIIDNSDEIVDRCIRVPSQDHILLDVYMQLHVARPMPVYSVPGLVDHF